MRMQKQMVESFQIEHRNFVGHLNESLAILEKDIEEAREIDNICTGEWCRAIEVSLDELAKEIYSISEPRWVSSRKSRVLRELRHRVHDIYARYRGLSSTATH